MAAQAGEELLVPDVDDEEVGLVTLREQADKLREVIGNPFTHVAVDDFYSGTGLG